MVHGDVHVADDAARLDAELRDEEVTNAEAIFFGEEELRPDLCRLYLWGVYPVFLPAA